MCKVCVVNVRDIQAGDKGVVYVGRACAGWRASVLGNPFKLGVDGSREVVIQKYKAWLWAQYKKGGEVRREVLRLVEAAKSGQGVVLGCWCKPLACHGDVVKALVLWLVRSG